MITEEFPGGNCGNCPEGSKANFTLHFTLFKILIMNTYSVEKQKVKVSTVWDSYHKYVFLSFKKSKKTRPRVTWTGVWMPVSSLPGHKIGQITWPPWISVVIGKWGRLWEVKKVKRAKYHHHACHFLVPQCGSHCYHSLHSLTGYKRMIFFSIG